MFSILHPSSLRGIDLPNIFFTYLQNVENTLNDKDFKSNNNDKEEPHFEVDSIELVTPELFSDDGLNNETNEKDLQMFDNINQETNEEIKEQEMFEDTNLEENFEIPAFLRRQKN